MVAVPIAVNVHTVRDYLARDFAGTLKRVAEIGYTTVEIYDTCGLSPEQLHKAVTDAGLTVCDHHTAMEPLFEKLSETIEVCQALGCRHLTNIWIPKWVRKNAAQWRETARRLCELGAKCAEQGIQLCHHNHGFEFEQVDGTTGFDLLFNTGDPRHLQPELDVYWAVHAGADPVALIERYAGRCPLIHMKDRDDDPKIPFTELGTGSIDFEPILAATQAAGVQWNIVEQDECKGDSLESIRSSLEYLRSKGWA